MFRIYHIVGVQNFPIACTDVWQSIKDIVDQSTDFAPENVQVSCYKRHVLQCDENYILVGVTSEFTIPAYSYGVLNV